jgi:hypothetical protein
MPLSDTSSVGSTRSLWSYGSFSVDEPMGSQREPAVETPLQVASQRPYFHSISTNARYMWQGDTNALNTRRFHLKMRICAPYAYGALEPVQILPAANICL